MESQPDTGIVISANWVCEGTQDSFFATITGSCVFPIPEGNYVPYADLQESEVLNWCWTDGGVNKDLTESAINSALEAQVNPVVVNNPLPWGN